MKIEFVKHVVSKLFNFRVALTVFCKLVSHLIEAQRAPTLIKCFLCSKITMCLFNSFLVLLSLLVGIEVLWSYF